MNRRFTNVVAATGGKYSDKSFSNDYDLGEFNVLLRALHSTPPKFYITVNSKDRESKSLGSHDYYINLTNLVSNDYDAGRESWWPVSITLPYTRYTIDSYNDKIYFSEASTAFTATLTHGVYNSTTLASEVTAAMNATAATNVYTCATSSLTHKFTISQTNDAIFAFTWASNTTNSAARTLGFDETNGTEAKTDIVSDNVYDLSRPSTIRVIINNQHTMIDTTDQGCTFNLPVNVSWGSVLHYTFEPPEDMSPFKLSSRIVHVQLLDWNDDPVDLQGSDWQMVWYRH